MKKNANKKLYIVVWIITIFIIISSIVLLILINTINWIEDIEMRVGLTTTFLFGLAASAAYLVSFVQRHIQIESEYQVWVDEGSEIDGLSRRT